MILHLIPLSRLPWSEARDIQYKIRDKVKVKDYPPFFLYPCIHTPVYTLGRNFTPESMPHSKEFYQSKGIEVQEVDRGGDITYHGPGQLTVYFIFNMNYLYKDINRLIHDIEEVVLHVLDSFQINGQRNSANSGVWVKDKKMCAIGLGFKHWVSYHGIGFNINTNMEHFNYIVPCGLKSHGVTSLSTEIKRPIEEEKIVEVLVDNCCKIFGFEKCIEWKEAI